MADYLCVGLLWLCIDGSLAFIISRNTEYGLSRAMIGVLIVSVIAIIPSFIAVYEDHLWQEDAKKKRGKA